MCAAHFVLLAPADARDPVAAGRQLMRFWLTATRIGLHLQPEVTPLVFARYVQDGTCFTGVSTLRAKATAITNRLTALVEADGSHSAIFMGRVGVGATPRARSLRLPSQRLIEATHVSAA
jgi:hypothetical protein